MSAVVCIVWVLGSSTPSFAAERSVAEERVALITAALEHYLCFYQYWYGDDFRRGARVSVKVLVDGRWFYARIDPPFRKSTTYRGAFEGQHARVLKPYTEEMLDQEMPWLRQWFAERPTISFEFVTPRHCPCYHPPSAEKERMFERIVRSMGNYFRGDKQFLRRYDEVHLVIAYFNVEDEEAFVLVEETGKVYSIVLHLADIPDEDDWWGEEYSLIKEDVSGTNLTERDIRRMHAEGARKVRAHGIRLKMSLKDIAGKPRAPRLTPTPAAGDGGEVLAEEGFPSEEIVERIREALERITCYDMYWLGRDYRPGVLHAAEVGVKGDRFYALVEQLDWLVREEYVDVCYQGILEGERARVYESRSLPTERKVRWCRGLVGERPTMRLEVRVPTNCPRYDPPSAEKERMIENVVRSVRKYGEERYAFYQLPPLKKLPPLKQMHLVIADFNVDYPATFVLLEDTREFYKVWLHAPGGELDDARYKSGDYHSRPIYSRWDEPDLSSAQGRKRFVKKLRKHGIRRTIVLEDEAGKTSAPPSTPTPAAAGSSADAPSR